MAPSPILQRKITRHHPTTHDSNEKLPNPKPLLRRIGDTNKQTGDQKSNCNPQRQNKRQVGMIWTFQNVHTPSEDNVISFSSCL